MSSKIRRRRVAVAVAPGHGAGQPVAHRRCRNRAGTGPRFYPDDPIWHDDDMRDDSAARRARPVEELRVRRQHVRRDREFVRAGAQREHARRSAGFELVHQSARSARHDRRRSVLRGPNQVDGPAPGSWEVTGRPDAGITPKFTIRDARGDTYLIKLDPASNPELPSSVELISTKIFHAIGYHVPEDFIVTFTPDRLSVAAGARARNITGDRVPIERKDVERWLRHVPKQADGSIRALASRYVPGKVVGQFMYTGRRSDDPNDLYPHERRRELRGMRVFAAWLNHDDARAINSIDTYVDDNGRRYIRHYMQDFGSNLGSGSTSAQQPRGGYEYLIERGQDREGSGRRSGSTSAPG